MVAVQSGNNEGRAIMYLNWKDFQIYMDDFRRDIQDKFDEHTQEHRSEKNESKAFKIAIFAALTSCGSAIFAGLGLLLTHLH